MKIRPMTAGDLDFAASLTAGEGWDSETRPEIEGLFQYNPGGCFIAQSGDQKIGMCIGTNYRGFGFLGELIVLEEQRGSSIGERLLRQTIGYLQKHGARTVFLDGVLAAVPLYERAGFVRLCRSWRFGGSLAGTKHPHIRTMIQSDLTAVAELDQKAFGADRRFFLERRMKLYPRLCKVFEEDNHIYGYIMARRGRTGISVGPWIATPELQNPAVLLESLALETDRRTLRIGVLEANPTAQAVLKALGFEASSQSPWRMALGEAKSPGNSALSYAIGSPAKG